LGGKLERRNRMEKASPDGSPESPQSAKSYSPGVKPSSIPLPETTPTKTQSYMTLYGYKSPRDSPLGSPRRSASESLKSRYTYSMDELRQLKAETEQKENMLHSIKSETLTLRTTIQKYELQHQSYEETMFNLQKRLKILANRLESLQSDITQNHEETLRNHELKEKQMKLDNDTSMYNMEKSYRAEIERILTDKVGKIQKCKSSLTSQVEGYKEELRTDDIRLKESIIKLSESMKRKEEEVRSFMIKEREELESESNALDEQLEHVESQIQFQKDELQKLKDEKEKKGKNFKVQSSRNQESSSFAESQTDELTTLKGYIKFTEEMIDTMKKEMECKISATESFEEAILLEEERRRRVHNKLQELKGNIRVFCRIRPRLKSELQEEELYVQVPDNDEVKQEIEVQDIKGRPSSTGLVKKYNFKFDKVFQKHSTNTEIFDEISQLVQSALYGFNVCIFAYGQTGSGKTHTMSSNDGIIPQTITQIFETCHKLEGRGCSFKIFGEFLQIYNENIMDLIDDSDDKRYEIKHDQTTKSTYITNITRLQFLDPEEMNRTLQNALKNRSVASTKSNERSSRSHTVCIIRIQVKNSQTGDEYSSVLNLIDLAGSERISQSQVSGDRLKETQAINKSLSSLGDVIYALGDSNAKHIPFRNSKLTYLLQYSLLEDSKTLMFVNISPLEKNLNETINSLRFATKVNNTGLQRNVR
jgi:kinesin family protein C1